jgi:hypothetical protein
MDLYSLETLVKLHHNELVQEGLREQAIHRHIPGKRSSKLFERKLLMVMMLIMLIYWLLV